MLLLPVTCQNCGTECEPAREHARFCSARCRVAYSRKLAYQERESARRVTRNRDVLISKASLRELLFEVSARLADRQPVRDPILAALDDNDFIETGWSWGKFPGVLVYGGVPPMHRVEEGAIRIAPQIEDEPDEPEDEGDEEDES